MLMLNIGGSANLKSYVKFNSKVGRWFVRGADGEDKEIERPTFVIDLENLATGWIQFVEGRPPERVMDVHIGQVAKKPGENFKRGFIVMAYSQRYFGGTAEFSSASLHLCNSIADVYAQYETAKESNPGKVPVVACTGSQPMKDRYGINYRPTFTITDWVARPPGLPNASPVAAQQHAADLPPKPAALPLSDEPPF